MSTEYVPTTEDVREWYSESDWSTEPADALVAFDRWLAAHDRAVKAEAWDEGAYAAGDYSPEDGPKPFNPYRDKATE